MKTYLVSWEIELDAEDEKSAARKAHRIMQDPDSIATVFSVQQVIQGKKLKAVQIDLDTDVGLCEKCGQSFFSHNDDGSCVED